MARKSLTSIVHFCKNSKLTNLLLLAHLSPYISACHVACFAPFTLQGVQSAATIFLLLSHKTKSVPTKFKEEIRNHHTLVRIQLYQIAYVVGDFDTL